MKTKTIVGFFFIGLLLLVILEVVLIWVFNQVVGLPVINIGYLNALLGFLAVAIGGFLVSW
jgi:hypothetical protein